MDTSGSCTQYSEFLTGIARLAVRLGAVELYEAPNGSVEIAWRYDDRRGRWASEYVNWGPNWPWRNRTILFLGDFDGGDSVIEASWRNRVVWLSCEERYKDTSEHNWCRYTLAQFRGRYFPCTSPGDLLQIIRRLRA